MGTTVVSKLTSKYQTTIPSRIRDTLGLAPGDLLAFEVAESGAVILRKWTPLDLELARALEPSLSEWASEEDDEAYREL
jgi:antitoxin PrlF